MRIPPPVSIPFHPAGGATSSLTMRSACLPAPMKLAVGGYFMFRVTGATGPPEPVVAVKSNSRRFDYGGKPDRCKAGEGWSVDLALQSGVDKKNRERWNDPRNTTSNLHHVDNSI